MLAALNESGQIVYLTPDISREQLKRIRSKQSFYCPNCKEILQLKIGTSITPHFSHRYLGECPPFSEGESEQHILGKLQLYDWLANEGHSVYLEQTLPKINQRPDLLVKIEGKFIPIEFQCSKISADLVKKRNDGYEKLRMPAFWLPIAQSKFYEGVQTVRLSPFYQQFINDNQLITYDVRKRQFHHYMHLLPLAGYRFLALTEKVMVKKQRFPIERMAPLKKEDVLRFRKRWIDEKQRFIEQKIRFNKKGIKDPFLKACYDERISPLHLPDWIGVPVDRLQAHHSVEWQFIFVLMMQRQNLIEKEYPIHAIRMFIQRYPMYHLSEKDVQSYWRFLQKNKKVALKNFGKIHY